MKDSTYQTMRELEDSHWWFVARRSIIEAVIRRQGVSRPARLLEVGCGTGGNIAMLSKFGDLTGVEHDAGAAIRARERAQVPILEGSLPDALPTFEKPFDWILALDVIEHVEEDAASVKSMAAHLKPGGRLLLTVPAFNFLWSQHDVENHHFRRYRKRDMRRLAHETGLRLNYLSYFNFWLFPAVALIRLVRKLLPYEETWQDMRKPAPWANGLLERVFLSERRLMRWFALPFGISLMAVFTKDDAVH